LQVGSEGPRRGLAGQGKGEKGKKSRGKKGTEESTASTADLLRMQQSCFGRDPSLVFFHGATPFASLL